MLLILTLADVIGQYDKSDGAENPAVSYSQCLNSNCMDGALVMWLAVQALGCIIVVIHQNNEHAKEKCPNLLNLTLCKRLHSVSNVVSCVVWSPAFCDNVFLHSILRVDHPKAGGRSWSQQY